MKLFEFVGSPGSGKSTLLPEVKKIYSSLNSNIFTIEETIYYSVKKNIYNDDIVNILRILPTYVKQKILKKYYFKFGLRNKYGIEFIKKHSALFNYVLSSQISRNIPRNYKDKIIEEFLITGGNYEFSARHLGGRDSLIMDEGFAQKAISLFVSENEKAMPGKIKEYINKIPDIFGLVVVNANSRVCLQRIKKGRERFRLKGKSDKDIINLIDYAKDACEYIVSYIKEKKEVSNIIYVDSNMNLDETIKNLRKSIPQWE